MEYAHIGSLRPLRRLFFTLVLGFLCAGPALAADTSSADAWHRWHDNVTITGTPASSVTAGQAYSFMPQATDTSGRTLRFAIANKPAWASFSDSTGQLSGTPTATSAGTYAHIVIAASDGYRYAVLPAFTVTVTSGSSSPTPPPTPAPTISGTPATSDAAGSAYMFQPNASGPNGMTLSFSVANKPTWANFSIATGQLSGTPTTAQTGTYSNIVLSVSDGQSSAALPSFSITVTNNTAPSTGNAVINWTPPTQNTDGSALTNLAGVRIYYGSSATNLNQMVQLTSSQTSYTISNLASGTWYFGGVAYTTAGTQSSMSSVVSANVP
jgi:hypothetical protein